MVQIKMSKFVLAFSTFALAIGGFLVTKANKKYSPVYSGIFVHGGSVFATLVNMSLGFTTTASGKRLVKMVQTAGLNVYTVIATLYTDDIYSVQKVYR